MTIRLRLALLFTTATLILLAGGGTLFVSRLQTGLEQSLTLTLRARADTLATALAGAPVPITQDYLRRNRLQHTVNGTFAQVLTPQGRLVDDSRLVADHPLLTPEQAEFARTRTLVLNESVHLSGSADGGAEAMRVLARRIRPSGDILVVALSRDVADQAVSGARNQLILLGLGVLVLAGPGAWLLTGAALRPVERMRRQVRELHARNAGAGLQVPNTRDEIARLAETFNALLARMHSALAREQALVADAGHELRTPLTVLKGELELARRPHRTRHELAETVEVAAAETDRLVRLTDDLLFLSSEDVDGERGFPTQDVDLTAIATQSVAAVTPRALQRGVQVRVDARGPVPLRGNPDWLRRAVDNLLANAVRHAPAASTVTVAVTAGGEGVRLAVRDEGAGFPADFLPYAFDRFSRADDARARMAGTETDAEDEADGMGLGLAIVASIAARHHASVSAANRREGGAEVTLHWRT